MRRNQSPPPRDLEPLQRWLAAEESADEQAAEVALSRLLRSTPRQAPSAGFAERTLTAAGIPTAKSRLRRLRSPGIARPAIERMLPFGPAAGWRGWASAAGVGILGFGFLLMVGLGVTLGLQRIGWIAPFPGIDLTPADPFEALIAMISAFWQWIASGVVLWQRAAGIGDTVRGLIESPDVALALVTLLVIAVSSFKALQVVLANDVFLGRSALVTDRSRLYVDSH